MSPVRNQTLPVPVLLTPQKTADLIGIGRTRLLALAREGKVKVRRDGDRRYFVTASVLAYIGTMDDRA